MSHDSPEAFKALQALQTLLELPTAIIGLHYETVLSVSRKLRHVKDKSRKRSVRHKKHNKSADPLRTLQPQPTSSNAKQIHELVDKSLPSKDSNELAYTHNAHISALNHQDPHLLPVNVPNSITLLQELPSPQLPSVVAQLVSELDTARAAIIKELTDPAIEAAVTNLPDCVGDDPRYLDLTPSAQTPVTRGKRLHARRWLANSYEQWLQVEHGRSRVDELLKNPKSKPKYGTADAFLNTRRSRLKNTDVAKKGLWEGLKMLILERLCGWDMVSAIVNYQSSYFRDTNLSELKSLSSAVKSSAWMIAFVQGRPGWLASRQARYDSCFGPSPRLVIQCAPSSLENAISQPARTPFEESELEGMKERSNTSDPGVDSISDVLHHSTDIMLDLQLIAGKDVPDGPQYSTQNQMLYPHLPFQLPYSSHDWATFDPMADSNTDVLHHSTSMMSDLRFAGQDVHNSPQCSTQNERELQRVPFIQPPYPQ